MSPPTNILYVTNGLEDCGALEHVLNMSQRTQASLSALIVCPMLPEAMRDYQGVYEEGLQRRLRDCLDGYRQANDLQPPDLDMPIEVENGYPPAQQVVRRTLQRKHDLLIKEAHPSPGSKGFKAVDMVLVRKCECPVWLYRPPPGTAGSSRVAVAIDPESVDPAGHELSIYRCSASLECWLTVTAASSMSFRVGIILSRATCESMPGTGWGIRN